MKKFYSILIMLVLAVFCLAFLGSCEEHVECLVTFVDFYNGATHKTVMKGEKVARPTPDPTTEGAEFTGWYSDEACTKEYDFNSPVTGNIEIYAGWKVNTHNVNVSWKGVEGATTSDEYKVFLTYLDETIDKWVVNDTFGTVVGDVNKYTFTDLKDTVWKNRKIGVLVNMTKDDIHYYGQTDKADAITYDCKSDITIPQVTMKKSEK